MGVVVVVQVHCTKMYSSFGVPIWVRQLVRKRNKWWYLRQDSAEGLFVTVYEVSKVHSSPWGPPESVGDK